MLELLVQEWVNLLLEADQKVKLARVVDIVSILDDEFFEFEEASLS